jgi:hypothetical protein
MKLGGLAALAAFFAIIGAFGLSPTSPVSADITSISAGAGSFDSGGSVTITIGAHDDDLGDLVIAAAGDAGTITVNSCSGAGADQFVGPCGPDGGITGQGTASVTIVDDGIDADTLTEAITLSATLGGTCDVQTPITVTATQDGTTASVTVLCNPVAAPLVGDVEVITALSEHAIDPAGTAVAQGDCRFPADDLLIYSDATGLVTSLVLPRLAVGAINPLTGNPPIGGAVTLCANVAVNGGPVTFDGNDVGLFAFPSCGDLDNDNRVGEFADDACVGVTGTTTDQIHIPEVGNNSDQFIIDRSPNTQDEQPVWTIVVTYLCNVLPGQVGGSFPVVVQQGNDAVAFNIACRGAPARVTLTAAPATVEIIPARSNTSHSLIQAAILDAAGNAAFDTEVLFITDRCSIEEAGVDTNAERSVAAILVFNLNPADPFSFAAWEFSAAATTPVDGGLATASSRLSDNTESFAGSDLNGDGLPDDSRAAAVLGCNPVDAPGVTPGVATITVIVSVPGGADIVGTVTVTVIGPPASITVAASPTSLTCGEKSTITATVKDSIGQNVSDHTRVELVTNLGGVLAGTGAVAGSAGPVVPVSSTVAETFGGVATAFLLTSDAHEGAYEVVATSGGTQSTDPNIIGSPPGFTVLGGQFSTPPVSAQVTVNCSFPAVAIAAPVVAPAVQPPRVGQGITPPNTGDAGLADSSSSWTLLAIGGIALGLVGLASLKFARR